MPDHSKMTGLLVHGDNHFIVAGPKPSAAQAVALIRHWSLIRIGGAPQPAELAAWSIVTKAFREDLSWCWIVSLGVGEQEHSAAVRQLLEELENRGVCPGYAPAPALP